MPALGVGSFQYNTKKRLIPKGLETRKTSCSRETHDKPEDIGTSYRLWNTVEKNFEEQVDFSNNHFGFKKGRTAIQASEMVTKKSLKEMTRTYKTRKLCALRRYHARCTERI